MAERKNLGQVLHQYGRIGVEEQELALQYQRRNGGYFGEALVSLGIISHEELEFGLAAQFNLPYVFPDPEAIDPEASRIVAAEWALRNLSLPIARTDESLRVIVDSPIKPEVVEELEALTGLRIDLAIASPARIRELILHVFGEGAPEEKPRRIPVSDAGDFLDQAIASGAVRLGISVRGQRVIGWWEEGEQVHRTRLLSGWPGAVERRVELHSPEPDSDREFTGEGWDVRVAWGGTELEATMYRVGLPVGEEIVLEMHPVQEPPQATDPPAWGTIAEVALLIRSQKGRFLFTSDPEPLGAELLPALPQLFLGPSVRSLHLTDEGHASASAVAIPEDVEEARGFLASLREFRLDALTAETVAPDPARLEALKAGASAIFLRLSGDPDATAASARPVLREAGFSWELRVRARDGGEGRSWILRPLREVRPDPRIAGGSGPGDPPSASSSSSASASNQG